MQIEKFLDQNEAHPQTGNLYFSIPIHVSEEGLQGSCHAPPFNGNNGTFET